MEPTIIKYITKEEFAEGKSGYILVPYRMICTKTIITDKNGTREYWNINKWQRFKLWLYKTFNKANIKTFITL